MSSISKLSKQLDILSLNYEHYLSLQQYINSININAYSNTNTNVTNDSINLNLLSLDQITLNVNNKLNEINNFYILNNNNQHNILELYNLIEISYNKKDIIDEVSDLPRYGEKTKQKIIEIYNKCLILNENYIEFINNLDLLIKLLTNIYMQLKTYLEITLKQQNQVDLDVKQHLLDIKTNAIQIQIQDKHDLEMKLYENANIIRSNQLVLQNEMLTKVNIVSYIYIYIYCVYI
mgnify:FL=1